MTDKRYEVEARVTIPLSSENIEDLVVTALNGGIGYWAILDNSRPEFRAMPENECVDAWTAKILMDGGEVQLIDVEDHETVWALRLGNLLEGIRRFVEGGYDRYGAFSPTEVDMGNIDADCADQIVQLGLFGRLEFG